MNKTLTLILLFSLLGGLSKIVGGLVYGSRALFVDALTSIANFIAVVATIHFYKLGLKPPDRDHHYGHYKLGYGGPLVSIIAYSFVAGVIVVRLSFFEEYHVEIGAPLLALLGFIFYGLAILFARRVGEYFLPYSLFTVSELIESVVVVFASLVGVLYSYLVDYAGAVILAAYLFIELFSSSKELMYGVSDIAPSEKYIEDIKSFIESRGFTVLSIKVRKAHTRLYHGDIVVKPVDTIVGYSKLILMINDLKKLLYKEYNLDASIELG